MFGFKKYRKVSHSDGLIQFRVPKEWVDEVDGDGNRVLWKKKGISGTLRVSVLTAKKEHNTSGNPAVDLLGPREPVPVVLDNGNAYREYINESQENGEKIIIYFFEIGNFVKPLYYRLVLYTYTIYAAHKDEKDIQNQVGLLKEELPNTVFASEVQEWEK